MKNKGFLAAIGVAIIGFIMWLTSGGSDHEEETSESQSDDASTQQQADEAGAVKEEKPPTPEEQVIKETETVAKPEAQEEVKDDEDADKFLHEMTLQELVEMAEADQLTNAAEEKEFLADMIGKEDYTEEQLGNIAYIILNSKSSGRKNAAKKILNEYKALFQ